MTNSNKLVDYLFALSLCFWAYMGISESLDNLGKLVPVRLSLSILQVTIAFLFWIRPAALTNGNLKSMLLAFPSFLASGLLFKLSMPIDAWPVGVRWLFALATLWVLVCFISLWGNFAIFPALRTVVQTGPYRFVRHPAYLGELVMATTCVFGNPSIFSAALLVALVPLLGLRVYAEESVLVQANDYSRYKQSTPWRLIPRIW